MESAISLMEVAGENDSLLQQIPEDDLLNLEQEADRTTAGNSGFFLCSPLLTDRSNGTAGGSSSTTSSTDYFTDKENINANNIEGPQLSIMRQQMKRKKKAGGYNLRKSLAWNKAFFTEEGVLDSVELSMITGSTSTSYGEALGTIDEEIPVVPGGGCYNDLSLQDKLFKDTSTSTPSGDRKNSRCLLPKRGSSTKDNAKLKELSAKDINRSGSKRGSCPRPVASSRAKRPSTSDAATTVNKERVSRVPVPKRDPTVISRAPRNAATISARDAKSNQVAQRAGSNPKMTALKGPSTNAKRALDKDVNASKSLKAKTSIQQPRRKLANPVSKVNCSRSQHVSADSYEGLKAAKNSLISKPLPVNDDGTRKVYAPVTQSALPDGHSMLNQKTQMPKPSGLRMPSPSMGFFCQKKVSSFQSVPPDTSELHGLSTSNIPNVRITGPSNPVRQFATLVPGNAVKANHGEASEDTNVVSSLSLGSSVEPVSHDRAKSALKVVNIHLGKVNAVGSSTMNKVLSAPGLEQPDVRSLFNPVLEHLGDVSRIHDEINDQLAECEPHHMSFNNFVNATKSYLDETNDGCSQGMRRALDDQLSGAEDCNEQSSEQVELTNFSNCMIERTPPDHQKLGTGTCNSLKRSRTSIEFEHSRYEENVGNVFNSRDRCSFDQDEALETHKMRILRTRKAEASDFNHCISNECNNTMQSTSALPNSDSMHIDDEEPTVSMSNSKPLQGNGCSLTSQHDYTSRENVVLPRESNEVCENKLESEIDLSSIPHSTADACLVSGPVDRNCNHHTNEMVDIGSDMQQNNTFLEMEKNQDDHGDVEVACNADTAETLLISQDLRSSVTENEQYEAYTCLMSEQVQNEDKQNSPVLSSVNDFNQLPGFTELQNCCIDLVGVSLKSNQGKCSIDDFLRTSNSEEYNEEIINDSVMDSSVVSTSECLSSYNQMASPKDNSSIHEETRDTRMGDNILKSSKCSTAKSSEYEKIPSDEATSDTISKYITSEAKTIGNDLSFCLPTEGSCSSSLPNDDILSTENVQQHIGTEELENHKCPEMNGNILRQNENEFDSDMDHLLDTEICSTYYDKAQSQARTTCNNSSFFSPTENLDSSIPHVQQSQDDRLSCENVQHYIETKEPENYKSPEMNENILCQNKNELNSEMDSLLDMETCSTYDDNSQSMQLRKSEELGKQNAMGIKTSTNAVPFSEEWLAAIEAAGEDILTMKTGAVQNSPPDKSQPEPGPWSPVKRKKNQGIGPFDCTKCTNADRLHESC